MDETVDDRTTKPATAARIYDYLLGGSNYFPADEEAAKKVIAAFPVIPMAVRANRATLARMVRYLAEAGVRQFLDVGSGMPTRSSVHEVAGRVAADCRVVYVDIDPIAVAESQELLKGSDLAIAVRGDLREPEGILGDPQVRSHLDFDRPIALLLFGILHFVADDAVALNAVATLTAALAPGSYVGISHLAVETIEVTKTSDDSYEDVREVYHEKTATPVGMRDWQQVSAFFGEAAMVEPGLVWMTRWRPQPGAPDDFADDPRRSGWWAGLARR